MFEKSGQCKTQLASSGRASTALQTSDWWHLIAQGRIFQLNISTNNKNRKDNKNDTKVLTRQKLTGGHWIGQLTDRLKLERSESSVAVADRQLEHPLRLRFPGGRERALRLGVGRHRRVLVPDLQGCLELRVGRILANVEGTLHLKESAVFYFRQIP